MAAKNANRLVVECVPAETAARVVLELPISADVDDFRRVLASGAKP